MTVGCQHDGYVTCNRCGFKWKPDRSDLETVNRLLIALEVAWVERGDPELVNARAAMDRLLGRPVSL